MGKWYFDDIPVNSSRTSKAYVVPEAEMVAFAKKWDPQPIHTDREAAEASPHHRGLIASATYTVAVAAALSNQLEPMIAVIGASDWKIRFPVPVRPNDSLTLTCECVHKRESRTKPDRGVAGFVSTVRNQKGEPVAIWETNILIPKRKPVVADGI